MGQFGIDDFLLLLAWLSALANCIMACLSTQYGSGLHEKDVKLAWLPTAIKLAWGTRLCYICALGFVKLSIAVFYLRVFNVTRTMRVHLYTLIAFIAAITIMLSLQSIFSCIPPSKAWNPDEPGKCSDNISWFWVSLACQLASDIWIIGFAIPRVWALKMQRTQKIALLSMLTLGWLTVIAAIIRAVKISTILTNEDLTWVSYDSSIWAAVEVNVAIVCAAAPAWKPIFKRWTPGLLYSLSGRTAQQGPPYGERSTWANGTPKAPQAFELSRSRKKIHDLTSPSQEELAQGAAPHQWGTGTIDIRSSNDGNNVYVEQRRQGTDDVKGTTVSVWPLQGGS
jgi:hypothetical protein